jgi:hypothetical protein
MMPAYSKKFTKASAVKVYEVDEWTKGFAFAKVQKDNYKYQPSEKWKLCCEANEILVDNGYNPITAEPIEKAIPIKSHHEIADWLRKIKVK